MCPNVEPQKWRDGIDPSSLPLQTVTVLEVLGYPHAANQVFYIKGLKDGKEGCYYLKVAHHVDANIRREVEIIRQLDLPLLPKIAEYDESEYRYELTEEIEGKRLSVILSEQGTENALPYMKEMGETLAGLHRIRGSFSEAPRRRFHDIPPLDYCQRNGIEHVYQWLVEHRPEGKNESFVHGDFHYANILWRDEHICGILDFELAGMGDREFDIAWSLILRPGQRFMKTEEERQAFLEGYASLGDYDRQRVEYYMVLIYSRFMKFDDEPYEQYVRTWMDKAIASAKRP